MIKSLIQKYKLYIGLVLALGILAGACYLTWLITDSQWQSKYDSQQTAYADASAKAQQSARDKEQEYATNLKKIQGEANARVAESAADAASANAAVNRLYAKLNKILANTSAEVTGTRQQGKSANETVVLLANVLQKSVERNRQLAAFADESWNAAAMCEASYDAVAK